MDNKQKRFFVIIVVLIFTLTSYFYHIYYENNIGVEENNELIIDKKESVLSFEKLDEKFIVIHLSGAVKNAGVYKISEDDRLIDLIKAAGGLSAEADLSNINLAAYLVDGQKVIIPAENKTEKDAEFIEMRTEGYHHSQSKLININTASIEKLIQLNGIGQSKAQAIIKFREKNGLFKNKEELTKVTGVGVKTLENIRDEISIR